MKRVIVVCLILLLFSGVAITQEAVTSGLTDADVKAFIKNYNSIQSELNSIGLDFEDLGYSQSTSSNTVIETFLGKYGLSGPNRVNKLNAISLCYGYLLAEQELNKDPMTAAMMKQNGIDPLASMRGMVNKKDCDVVSKNLSGLATVFAYSEDSTIYASEDTYEDDYTAFNTLDYEPKYKQPSEYTGKITDQMYDDDNKIIYFREKTKEEAQFLRNIVEVFFEGVPQKVNNLVLEKENYDLTVSEIYKTVTISDKNDLYSYRDGFFNFDFETGNSTGQNLYRSVKASSPKVTLREIADDGELSIGLKNLTG